MVSPTNLSIEEWPTWPFEFTYSTMIRLTPAKTAGTALLTAPPGVTGSLRAVAKASLNRIGIEHVANRHRA